MSGGQQQRLCIARAIAVEPEVILLGELIEYGNTEKIFINPIKKQTEDYITGRFG